MTHDPLRRRSINRMTPAELAIRHAVLAVEAAGASLKLTRAVTLLGEAAEAVGDHVDHPQDGDRIVLAWAAIDEDKDGRASVRTDSRYIGCANGDSIGETFRYFQKDGHEAGEYLYRWYRACNDRDDDGTMYACGREADAPGLIAMCRRALVDRRRHLVTKAKRDLVLLGASLEDDEEEQDA